MRFSSRPVNEWIISGRRTHITRSQTPPPQPISGEGGATRVPPAPVRGVATPRIIWGVPRSQSSETVRLLADTASQLADGKPILDILRPQAGPHALFHQLAFASARVQDVRFLFVRMMSERRRLGRAARQSLAHSRLPRPLPPATHARASSVARLRDHLDQAIRLDFESLYVFGAIFLDHWASATAYLAGLPSPASVTFERLCVRHIEPETVAAANPVLARLFQAHLGEMRWLQFQFRTFRNKFVEHAGRPWQRGTTMPLYGDSLEYRLWIPSPPGWQDGSATAREIHRTAVTLREHLVGTRVRDDVPQHPLELLAGLVDGIGTMNRQADRDVIRDLVGRAGITSPPFDTLAHRLACFARHATQSVMAAALANPVAIDLGSPAALRP
jgi:hypothetical protein